jgi:hypothetical protein
MAVEIMRNELPGKARESVAKGISSVIGDRDGVWQIDLASEPEANAWDIELSGPDHFHWARRFSGEDRDADVISEAIRSALLDQAA